MEPFRTPPPPFNLWVPSHMKASRNQAKAPNENASHIRRDSAHSTTSLWPTSPSTFASSLCSTTVPPTLSVDTQFQNSWQDPRSNSIKIFSPASNIPKRPYALEYVPPFIKSTHISLGPTLQSKGSVTLSLSDLLSRRIQLIDELIMINQLLIHLNHKLISHELEPDPQSALSRSSETSNSFTTTSLPRPFTRWRTLRELRSRQRQHKLHELQLEWQLRACEQRLAAFRQFGHDQQVQGIDWRVVQDWSAARRGPVHDEAWAEMWAGISSSMPAAAAPQHGANVTERMWSPVSKSVRQHGLHVDSLQSLSSCGAVSETVVCNSPATDLTPSSAYDHIFRHELMNPVRQSMDTLSISSSAQDGHRDRETPCTSFTESKSQATSEVSLGNASCRNK